jgi:glycosyltransferase involved in cell wall biosynthesis
MSASLPVVASPVGINSELIDNRTRGLFASGKEEWREALATLIAAPGLRCMMGQTGRAFVEQYYSTSTWFPRLLSIIETVAASHPRQ